MRKILLITLSLISISFDGQTKSSNEFNKLNEKGKKEGWWIQYLDTLLNPIPKEKAKYYSYVIFHNDKIDEVFKNRSHFRKAIKSYTEDRPKSNEPLPLNGKYTYIRKNYISEQEYENGYPVLFKTSFKGKESETVEFKKKFKNISFTYYYTFGKASYFFRNGDRGWTFYPGTQLY